ncbi:MAG: hypothetical protein A2626_02780 [Candidatus Nealsonbacteria bacterium RIFCSPHIGHO2_01_FULL_38_55]|uniref:Resolvase HTH domain-containing protein n=2 Tax=Candidatus Nealsoniibacteriota TaxID=1817911 RepID=A0A1G2EFT2_9BACT|nr:MAG: hypothetical protein A2626_02780 [Candidatus Nealsonbacteria bacterium RIFCSPHIGHO2_01_FULL_38_55]OGZ21904.1 MAG: hypothetical protein A3C48_00080 [Candidatus Nealsonbacteria bacterium RIFCSPHIGHO2_02_FULL_38_75]OGZ22720.1 MAG: hypothetical protein A2981_01425 [Candidatus Nealsonbacteria bacterium RIFCSPLOWO2_01_FULL_38_120]OGZ24637.1 MAG: hypothetical protein A2W71_02290 [Candidatus Nealsonbacteria bacterium RIFCSPLOWO2_02_39_8]OGZ26273.1 MAG: hypothetical protein A3I85_01265 [Candidat
MRVKKELKEPSQKVKEIFDRRIKGEKIAEIGKVFGISKQAIWDHFQRRGGDPFRPIDPNT